MPYLEHHPRKGGSVRRMPLTALPCRVGRSPTCHFVVVSDEVSKEHVEIFRVGDEYRIRDLGSTNGTFLNGARIIEAPLADHDRFQLGQEEIRFRSGVAEATPEAHETGPQTVLVTKKRRVTMSDTMPDPR
jgi:adenylate cyclase